MLSFIAVWRLRFLVELRYSIALRIRLGNNPTNLWTKEKR